MKIIYTKADKERHAEYGSEGGRKAARSMTKAARIARAKKASDAAKSKKKQVAHAD